MKRLLFVSSIIEVLAGLAVLLAPPAAGRLLLAANVSNGDIPLVRLCGVALLALGLACWLGRGAPGRAARGLSVAMLAYNLGAVIVLGTSGILSPPGGIALWPAVILHAAMTAWCAAALRANRSAAG